MSLEYIDMTITVCVLDIKGLSKSNAIAEKMLEGIENEYDCIIKIHKAKKNEKKYTPLKKEEPLDETTSPSVLKFLKFPEKGEKEEIKQEPKIEQKIEPKIEAKVEEKVEQKVEVKTPEKPKPKLPEITISYDRTSSDHRDVLYSLLEEINPDWFSDDSVKNKAKELSLKMAEVATPMLDVEGRILDSFKSFVLKFLED